mgnify:CR=1 FL=1
MVVMWVDARRRRPERPFHSACLPRPQVKGRRLDTEGGIRTRAQARLLAEQWSAVPLRVKIIMLLTDSYIEATTQGSAQGIVCI